MGTVTLSRLLSVLSLLHITYGNPVDCSANIAEIPPDFNQINGMWNTQLVSDSEEFQPKQVKVISRISANEKEANISILCDPTAYGERTTRNERVHDDKGTLSYRLKGNTLSVTILQPNVGSMIVYFQENSIYMMAVLYSKEISIPESEVNHFKQWSNCKNLKHFQEFKTTINQADKCVGKLEEIELNVQNTIAMDLLAKSSSRENEYFMGEGDANARLEIMNKGDVYTLTELFPLPDNVFVVDSYGKIVGKGDIEISAYKTEKGFMVLGMKTTGLTKLYLARLPLLQNWPNTITNPVKTTTQAALNTFKEQAMCFGTKYNYFRPNTEEQNEVSCADMAEKLSPLSVRQSLGRWNLVVSAHSNKVIALHETSAVHSALELREENHKYDMTMLAIFANYPVMVDMPVEEKDGYVTYKGSDIAIFRHFSKGCAVFTSGSFVDSLFLTCRTAIPSSEAMSEFAQYALRLNHTYIFFRRESASSCLDIPRVVTSPDLQRVSGKWKVVGSATFISKEYSPVEIEFAVEGEHLILSLDKGIKTKMEKRFDAFYDTKGGEIILNFHESPENSLFFWIGTKKEGGAALYLLSKDSTVDGNLREKFKLFASCLSIPNINLEI